jgi:hypothetical protein
VDEPYAGKYPLLALKVIDLFPFTINLLMIRPEGDFNKLYQSGEEIPQSISPRYYASHPASARDNLLLIRLTVPEVLFCLRETKMSAGGQPQTRRYAPCMPHRLWLLTR